MKKNSKTSFHPVSAPDFLPLEQLQAIQLQRLKFMVQRAYNHVGLFRKRMDDDGLEPTDVRSLDDVTKLPFTVNGNFVTSSSERTSVGSRPASSMRLRNSAT